MPMRGRGGRGLLGAAVAVVLLGGAGLVVGTGLPAAFAADVNYVALGDSYSSGVGAGDYDKVDPECKRSANAYSQRWVKEFSTEKVAKFTFVACSGAKTGDVESKQLSALSSDTTMVSMSIGGNDVGFSPVVGACLLTNLFDEDVCIAASAAAGVNAEKKMPGTLDALYKKIKDGAPNAKVYILGYPHIFTTDSCGTFGLGVDARKAINNATSKLNAVVHKAATDNGFTFVDGEQTFLGRGVCTKAPGGAWLTDSSAGRELYHPTQDGQEAYAVALDAAVRGFAPA